MIAALADMEARIILTFQETTQKEIPPHVTVAMLSTAKLMCFDPGRQTFVTAMHTEVSVRAFHSYTTHIIDFSV